MLHDAEIDERRFHQRSSPSTRRAWTPLARALAALGDHWTLMIAVALSPGRMRVTDLQRHLPGISAGVLARHVQHMVALGLVTRTRFKEMPPRVELELTVAGRELLPVAGSLARWGARNLWSPPRHDEQVDLDALLCLLPLLLEADARLPDGSVEALVHDSGPPIHRLYRVRDGRLWIDQRGEPAAAAPPGGQAATSDRERVRIHGDAHAWIAALGPAGERARLRISGDERLARGLLDALGG